MLMGNDPACRHRFHEVHVVVGSSFLPPGDASAFLSAIISTALDGQSKKLPLLLRSTISASLCNKLFPDAESEGVNPRRLKATVPCLVAVKAIE